ncbi:hypothetical protein BD410DRAFT_840586 [Rickenella mellea]|uniref:Uncharacterized protein n=1 Tax=Rickenella mellea TaxID=50990 RepID=A0A4Y7Q155_9AGAM|nr:hypothetical protein BD410DRAFT_840586 [Rickenella mellea]
MHPNTAVLLLALSAVTPALSAPLSLGSLGSLGKEVGKGLASGSALGGVVAGIEQLTGSSSTTTSKREFSEDDIALLKRAVSLGDLGKEVAKGLASGGALAGIVAGIDKLTGSSSTTTFKRELSDEDIALLKRAVSLGDLGKEIAKGLASGGALAGIVDGIDKLTGSSSTTTTSKREPLSLGSLGKAILGTGASLVTSSVVGDVIGDVTGQSSKRETITLPPTLGLGVGPAVLSPDTVTLDGESLTRREMEARGLLSSIVSDADSVITKGIVGGVASGIAGSVVGDIVGSKRDAFILPTTITPVLTPEQIATIDAKSTRREMEARGLLSSIVSDADSVITKGIVGGVASGIAGSVVGDIVGSKRETFTLPPTISGIPTPEEIAAILGKSSKRDIDVRSLLSKVLPAAEDTFEDVLKKAVAGGVGSAVGGVAVNSAVGDKNSKRELTDAQLLALMFAGGDDESSKRSLNDLD